MTSAMRRMATTWPSAPVGAAGRYSASFVFHPEIDGRQQASFSARSAKKCTNIRTIESERATAVVSNFSPRPIMTCAIDVSSAFGIDGVQGQRDADHGAQKAQDGDRPHNQAKQAIAAVGQCGVAVGKVLQFVAEALGRTQTHDIVHRRAEPAQIIFILPMCRLAIQLRIAISRQSSSSGCWPGSMASQGDLPRTNCAG